MKFGCRDATKALTRILWVLILLLSVPVDAADIAVVSHKKLGSVQRLAHMLASHLERDVDIRLLAEQDSLSGYKAVILAGPQAIAAWQGKTPAVAVFASKKVVQQYAAKLASAVYIEPPLTRQVALTKAILGDDRPLGVLVHNEAQWAEQQVDKESAKRLLITPYRVDKYENLNRALVDLLRNNHALVGVYDPELYSSANIKNILITAYRQNKPLIGPSGAYIKAGALATTFSDIDDIVKRLGEILRVGVDDHQWPEPGYNPYFKVRYNEQVGRSLNLLLPTEKKLQQQILQSEGN